MNCFPGIEVSGVAQNIPGFASFASQIGSFFHLSGPVLSRAPVPTSIRVKVAIRQLNYNLAIRLLCVIAFVIGDIAGTLRAELL
jgi:hypothetical protein